MIVVLTVPYAAQLATLQEVKGALAGKILIDVTVPLVPPQVSRVQLPDGGSAVVAAQALLGESVRVVSAFQNVSAELLADLGKPIDCDVLVCGDDREARSQVIALARDAGMRAFHAGPLANSIVAEALTSVLIAINRQYKVKHSGIVITGLPAEARRMSSPAPKKSRTARGGDSASRRWPAFRRCGRAMTSPKSFFTALQAPAWRYGVATSS